MPGDPFALDFPTSSPLGRAAARAARPLLRRALGLNTIADLYQQARARQAAAFDGRPGKNVAFATLALELLGVEPICDAALAADIPDHGPLVVAANHPHGVLDGLLLLEVVGRIRPDLRLVANRFLAAVPELRDLCFFVDPFEGGRAAHRSLAGLRAAHLWLRRGGALAVFPAGEVAHARRADGSVSDPEWRATVGRLAIGSDARVLPIHIDGSNSRLFYAVGRIHPCLRTVLLGRELLNRRGRSVRLRLGRTLAAPELATAGESPKEITEQIRSAVERTNVASPVSGQRHKEEELPVAPPIDSADLVEDVRRLPASAWLMTAGAFAVYCAEAAQIPFVLAEIGRLRERSFRLVGEGTGKSLDIDAFDSRYLHLFLWNRRTQEVVGAYRIARTDLIVPSTGVEGLYTRTLFRYDETLLNRLPPALELGRSFVRLEYQRDHNALLLLWKGVCAFVQRHPQYRVLFGAVSISARYTDRTREMLMRFLEQNHLDRQLAELVASVDPSAPILRQRASTARVPETIEEANAMVSQLESDGYGMPVLLRQYLKLNARVLGFNVDRCFADVLDALMMVDLLKVDTRILRRYFGPAGTRAFLEHHLSTPHAA